MNHSNKQFEELLKTSDYLNDVFAKQNEAMAQTMAIFLNELTDDDTKKITVITNVISELNKPTSNPSVNGFRLRIAKALRDAATRKSASPHN